MSEKTDFIAAAKANAEREKLDLERTIAVDQTQSFFARSSEPKGSLLEGLFLTILLAAVPFIAFMGLAMWAFSSPGDTQNSAWLFLGLSIAIPIFVLIRAMKSKSEANVSVLTDMMMAFWSGVFPIVMFAALAVLAVASFLGISFKAALALCIVAGLGLAFLMSAR